MTPLKETMPCKTLEDNFVIFELKSEFPIELVFKKLNFEIMNSIQFIFKINLSYTFTNVLIYILYSINFFVFCYFF